MEDSPYSATQAPAISWDMDSPQTSKISPRSIVLPRPETDKAASSPAAGVYFIEEWGSSQRNKRRIKRPPKPNLFKRFTAADLVSPTSPFVDNMSTAADTVSTTAVIDSGSTNVDTEDSDFDDWGDDEVLSNIRLTPLLPNKRPPTDDTSPTTPVTGNSISLKTHSKTPLKPCTRDSTVLPRKLSAEFDRTSDRGGKTSNDQSKGASSAAHYSEPHHGSAPPRNRDSSPSKSGSSSRNRGARTYIGGASGAGTCESGAEASKSGAGTCKNGAGTSKSYATTAKTASVAEDSVTVSVAADSVSVADEDMFSDEDEDTLRQVDLFLASQSSSHNDRGIIGVGGGQKGGVSANKGDESFDESFDDFDDVTLSRIATQFGDSGVTVKHPKEHCSGRKIQKTSL